MSTPTLLGDRYELRGVLGRGGMAEVHDAWDTRLHRPVAIKLLHPGFGIEPGSRERFESEARSAAALSHPNIVAVHDYGEHDGMPFIVMERLPGHTLADQINLAPLPTARVRAILDEVLAALGVAHRAGIVHRDIKPANVLFTAEGNVKVADFGIAKTAETHHTQTGQIMGTLAYMSPSRLTGSPAAVTDDLYALGCVGYEALGGRKPFPEESLGALARAILDDTPPPLRSLRPDVDPALAAVIERAMARDPQQSFPHADTMRAALWNPVAQPVSGPPRPATLMLTAPFAGTPPPDARVINTEAAHSRRTPKLAAGISIVAALLVAAILLVFNSPFDDAPSQTSSTTAATTPPPTTTVSSTTTPTSTAAPAAVPTGQPGGNRKGGKGNGNGNGNGKH